MKVALITGASRGIGAACTKKLAQEGYTIALNCSHDGLQVQELLSQIQKISPDSDLFIANVADAGQVADMFSALKEKYGQLDVLVNNAGITRDALILRSREEDFERVIDINLKGAYLCTRSAMKMMFRARKGSIVNMASVVGETGNIGQAAYASSKAGLIGLCKSAAKEGAARNIRVNAIAPGFIDTDMTRALDEETASKIKANIPLNYFGKPEQVAEVVSFLAGDKSSYITGQVINVDGGMVM